MRFSPKRLLIVLATLWVVLVIGISYKHLTISNYFLSTRHERLQEMVNSEIVPRNLEWSSRQYDLDDTVNLQSVFKAVNTLQFIRNSQFKPDLSSSGTVIVVQVHEREEDLKEMINSLRNIKGIHTTLLIFSHDLFSPSINKIIEAIDFCPVMQIFFPYAIQLYKNKFPAQSPSDCPRDLGKEKAKELGCSNADTPDYFGHYREAAFTQMKHHWVWKINFVCNEIRILQDYKGFILRIDNDYYIGPDILYVMQWMKKQIHVTNYSANVMLIMGDYENFNENVYKHAAQTFTNDYWSTGVGRGMAFTKDLWNEIGRCKQVFCTFDDYNWDFSLQKLVNSCLGGLLVFKPMATRVFHLGKCQGFHRKNVCSREQFLQKIKTFLRDNAKYTFPEKMSFIDRTPPKGLINNQKPNGGWGDPRDHKLCQSFFA